MLQKQEVFADVSELPYHNIEFFSFENGDSKKIDAMMLQSLNSINEFYAQKILSNIL